MTGEALGKALGLHPRGIWDFFDTLAALGFLERNGTGLTALYSNTAETGEFLDKNKSADGTTKAVLPDYMGTFFTPKQ